VAVASEAIAAPRKARFTTARHTAVAYVYILPAFAMIAFATLIGVGYTFYLSFTNYDLLDHFEEFEWIGIRNYEKILTGVDLGTTVRVLTWTLTFAFLSMAFSFIVGLLLALLLNDGKLRERGLYRTLLIVPWALPATIAILSWNGILNTDFGYMNDLLKDVGLGKVPWLSDPFWAKFSVLLVNTWLSFPFMMTACLGALQAVPDELHEAAEIDGAGAVHRFRYITLPYLGSVVVPLLIGNFAFQFNNFNVIYLLTRGNPAVGRSEAGETDILISYTYDLTLTQGLFAVAAAYATLIFLIIAAVSFVQMKLSGQFEEAR
jgi:arabinogalactan oligomer / maltooligosaccharide transport system permease protein